MQHPLNSRKMGIMISYSQLIIVSVVLLSSCSWGWIIIHRQLRRKFGAEKSGSSPSVLPTNWPIVGMVPVYFKIRHRIHDYMTEVLDESGGTFEVKGPWFANLDTLFTCDPANIQHVLVKNLPNYGKGTNFKKILEGFGHSFVLKEGKPWEVQRKAVGRMLNHRNFPEFAANTSWKKVAKGLIPVLDHYASSSPTSGLVNFQDIMRRFTFDTMSMVSSGHDPATLSVGLPEHPCLDAIDILMEGFFSRHFWPTMLWKLQKWLHIGMEKKLAEAWETVYEFIELCISLKGENSRKKEQTEEEGSCDVLTSLFPVIDNIMSCGQLGTNSTRLLRDMLFNIFVAGKETQGSIVTWLFWLLSRNPCEESKIRQEITEVFTKHGDENQDVSMWGHFISNTEVLGKLIYTRAALYEVLRLFSPVGIQHREAVNEVILPSGHQLRPGKRILLAFYSTGRMESIWGADCLDFKPSRWINVTEDGVAHIKNEPTHKYPVFGAGPAFCLGKDMALNQMVMAVATIVQRYQIQVAEGQDHVYLRNSVVINIKNGLWVKVDKRHV